jgi:hypothetical protein
MNYMGIRLSQIPQFWLTTDPTFGLKIEYRVVITYNPQLALVKASVLYYLLRLGGQKKWIRWSIYALEFSQHHTHDSHSWFGYISLQSCTIFLG